MFKSKLTVVSVLCAVGIAAPGLVWAAKSPTVPPKVQTRWSTSRQEVPSARRCRVSCRSEAGAEEPLLRCEVRCPHEAVRAREAQVSAEGVAHRVDEPVGAAW